MCFCLDEPGTWAAIIGLPILAFWLIGVNVALFYMARRSIAAWRQNTMRLVFEPRKAKPKRGHGSEEGSADAGNDWFGRGIVIGLFILLTFTVVYLVAGQ